MNKEPNGFTIKIDFPDGIEELIPKFVNFLEHFSGDLALSPKPKQSDEIMTADEVCHVFKIPKTKLYTLTMNTGPGSIPRFKIGRDLRFRNDEVSEWFEKQRV